MKRTTQAMPFTQPLRLSAALVLAAWLSGCAVQQESVERSHAPPIPEQHQAWFSGEHEVPIDRIDWSRVNRAQEFIEESRYDEAIEYLQPLMARDLPPAYYQMARLYDQGIGVEENPAEAARLYGLAIERPSSMRGHASLNLARLYQEGRGVERNDVLAYHLLWQAKDADLERTAEVLLADLLTTGGENVEADPALAHQLYREAAARGQAGAYRALAEGYSPGGWWEEDPAQAMDYAQHYAELLQADAQRGEVNAMLQLASLYSADGLLGDQPNQRMQWLQQAAQTGDLDALARAGRELVQIGEYQQGVELLENAAEQGHSDAMAYLGQALLEPDSGRPDTVAAEHWLNQAIDAGSVDEIGRAHV